MYDNMACASLRRARSASLEEWEAADRISSAGDPLMNSLGEDLPEDTQQNEPVAKRAGR